MNLLADESVDAPIVERLRTDGHSVAYVAEMSPSIPDEEVLERANTGPCPAGKLATKIRRTRLPTSPGHPRRHPDPFRVSRGLTAAIVSDANK